MKTHRVVVTGMGTVSPAGLGVPKLWEAVRAGRSRGSAITRFDPSRNACRIAAETPPLPVPVKPDTEDVHFSRTHRYALVAATEAMGQAGTTGFSPERAGVCIGSTTIGIEALEAAFNATLIPSDGPEIPHEEGPAPDLFSAYSGAGISAALAGRFGFRGPVSTLSTGCASGLDAIGCALDTIRRGEADLMVAGGADAAVDPIILTAFDVVRALTRRNDAAEQASRPFDQGRDGFLLAEGAGILVLEEAEHARRRGAVPLAEILGFASNCHAFHMTSMPEDGKILADCLDLAIADAGLSPDGIDYINAHGSSTPLNDRVETLAYKEVFGDRVRRIPISSTKSVIGHPLGAAGAIQAVVCVMAIGDSWLPPTANLDEPDPECDLDYVPRTGRSHPFRHALANANSFAGIHSGLVIGAI